MPDHGKIRSTVTFTRSAAIFIKSDIKYPVQVVFNGPVCPNCVPEFAGIICTEAAEKIAYLFADLAACFSSGGHGNNAL